MTIEEWRDIPGYEGIYQASSLGKIKSLNYNNTNKPKELSLGEVTSEYHKVVLFKNKKRKTFNVHQLIAMTFLENKL